MEKGSFITRELTSGDEQEVIEITDAESGVEAVGVNEQIRKEDIQHAREFRRVLIAETLKKIAEFEDKKVKDLMSEPERFWTTERRRQNYVLRHEAHEQAGIEELLWSLDLTNPEHQAVLQERLRQAYAGLKLRLMIVEMETRRLTFKVYGESTGLKETPDERRTRILSGIGEKSVDIADTVLIEIDGLRAEGMDDKKIFRNLQQRYHPDVSEHEKAHEITLLINALYDITMQHFLI